MIIDRTHIVGVLRRRGDDATADQAEMSLPPEVDSGADRDLLLRFGVSVHEPCTRPSIDRRDDADRPDAIR